MVFQFPLNLDEFKNREIKNEYPGIYIDATYIPLKRDSVAKEAVYTVMGIRVDGTRSILTYWLLGGKESAINWQEVFNNLKSRGLKTVKMIISDDLKGLEKAIDETYPTAKHQLCWFHLKKNIKNRVRKRHWNEILSELNSIMDEENQEKAESRIREFISKWSKIYRSFKELKDQLQIRGYMQSENSADKFLYLYFKDKGDRLSSRKLRYSEVLIEVLRELK